jgi:hypothetical protein
VLRWLIDKLAGFAPPPATVGRFPIPQPDIFMRRDDAQGRAVALLHHDQSHRSSAARLVLLAVNLDGMGSVRRNSAAWEIIRRAWSLGWPVDEKVFASAEPARLAAEAGRLGRNLGELHSVLQRLARKDSEAIRALETLANAITYPAVPPLRFLEPARAAWAKIDSAERIALVETTLATPIPLRGSGAERYVRALIFLSPDWGPEGIGPLLTAYALRECYVNLPGSGMRAEKLGNACLWALAALPDGAGVPFLARILARAKYPKIRAKIDEKLNAAAAAAGLSRAALDELIVPTHDLDGEGRRVFPLPGGRAILRVTGLRRVTIEWVTEKGRKLRAPSASMKADKAGIRALRDAAKEAEADLRTQIHRLQRLYLDDRSWPAAEWRQRYLGHPLVGPLAKRLVWWLDAPDGTRIAAIPDGTNGTMRDVAGAEVPLEGSIVRLWHPIDADPGAVLAWRSRLEAMDIAQPFPQAWREIYVPTDAEHETGTYSNRWAGHILKQHQAMNLARLNGWRTTHRMFVDSANSEPWHLLLAAHRLVADYWVEGAGGPRPEITDSAAYVHVSADRVQFHRIGNAPKDSAEGPERGPPVPLGEIPPLVFSEVMRHVDLMTAIASIAADPNWLDRGRDAGHPNLWTGYALAYWNQANTAELEESGKVRRAMFERIIPRLAIADRLALDDRHLLVTGTRHQYRIHLGSGACFRGSRHLCIVPKPAYGLGRPSLPFEGDGTFSIILSKALLLADDDRITDPVILAQL